MVWERGSDPREGSDPLIPLIPPPRPLDILNHRFIYRISDSWYLMDVRE